MKRKEHIAKGILGVFKQPDGLSGAIRELRAAGLEKMEVFSPVPSQEIQEALGLKPSPLGFATLAGALFGLVGGVSLAAYGAMSYQLVTQGKPLWAWIPWFVIGFECTILFGCLANFASMLILGGLLRWKRSTGYDPRFSVGAFGVFVICDGRELEKAKAILRSQGAGEIHERP